VRPPWHGLDGDTARWRAREHALGPGMGSVSSHMQKGTMTFRYPSGPDPIHPPNHPGRTSAGGSNGARSAAGRRTSVEGCGDCPGHPRGGVATRATQRRAPREAGAAIPCVSCPRHRRPCQRASHLSTHVMQLGKLRCSCPAAARISPADGADRPIRPRRACEGSPMRLRPIGRPQNRPMPETHHGPPHGARAGTRRFAGNGLAPRGVRNAATPLDA
jgi:hypothetical protein